MIALATRLFPRASADTRAEFEALFTIALFCGAGLLISISTIVLDKYIPGEWF
jgi:hypothetical protein